MLMRQKELAETILNLKYKIKELGGNPDQLELKV
jgi:hypothetical protein|tara:strand:- start:19 stop:120 length:102 start_codon:yes stop_codon:yes gene_type:complete